MTIQFWDDGGGPTILFVDGDIAMHEDCCCTDEEVLECACCQAGTVPDPMPLTFAAVETPTSNTWCDCTDWNQTHNLPYVASQDPWGDGDGLVWEGYGPYDYSDCEPAVSSLPCDAWVRVEMYTEWASPNDCIVDIWIFREPESNCPDGSATFEALFTKNFGPAPSLDCLDIGDIPFDDQASVGTNCTWNNGATAYLGTA